MSAKSVASTVALPDLDSAAGGAWSQTLGAIARQRGAAFGCVIVAGLIVAAVLADVIAPQSPTFQDYSAVLEPPSLSRPMGTDDIGRDQLSRVIHGARVSLMVAIVAVALSTAVGVVVGVISGYYGGWVDEAAMRLIDALWSFPSLLLALGIASALGRGLNALIIGLAVIGIAGMARLARGQVLATREMEYVIAARAMGATGGAIMWRHILPNIATPLIVAVTLGMATAILNEASLSFLGIGVQPPAPSWGSMLRSGYEFMNAALWLSVFPGLAIFLAVLGLTLLGDGAQILLDPKLRSTRRKS